MKKLLFIATLSIFSLTILIAHSADITHESLSDLIDLASQAGKDLIVKEEISFVAPDLKKKAEEAKKRAEQEVKKHHHKGHHKHKQHADDIDHELMGDFAFESTYLDEYRENPQYEKKK